MAPAPTTKYDTKFAMQKRASALSYNQISKLTGYHYNYLWMIAKGIRPCPIELEEAMQVMQHRMVHNKATYGTLLDETYGKEHPCYYWQVAYSKLLKENAIVI